MDTSLVVIILLALIVLVVFTFRKQGRRIALSWKHHLLGDLSAEAESVTENQNRRPEQIQENSRNIKQEMVGSSGGKQIAKDSDSGTQKIK